MIDISLIKSLETLNKMHRTHYTFSFCDKLTMHWDHKYWWQEIKDRSKSNYN